MPRRFGCAALVALALAGCQPALLPADPALWRIDGPHGERGWLFGTIHTLPGPVDWRTSQVAAALRGSDRLVVEIATLDDATADALVFQRMAQAPAQPPLSAKLPPALRPALARLLAGDELDEAAFAHVATWAAALRLAQIAENSGTDRADASWGIDQALLAGRGDEPVIELEGMERQLGVFARLPEAGQRRLLADVIAGARGAVADSRRLAAAWRCGDMTTIAAETRRGMLADPALREALYTARNRDWTQRIATLLTRGLRPFVATGAAHMAGDDGLPALLAARGYRVTRIE